MTFDIERISETAWLLRLGSTPDTATMRRVHALRHALLQADLPGLEDLVPGYVSILLRCRPEDVDVDEEGPPQAWQEPLERLAGTAEKEIHSADDTPGKLHRLPVCYGGAYGEDLDAVAKHLQLTPDEVIERHSAAEYRVAMLGFAPGFTYLLGLDASLEIPRRDKPRTRVPAGSIGLAGVQTGVYPSELPGGWQLIGRTPTSIFDASDESRPCLLMPGDRVCFAAIDADRFETLAGQGET